MMMRWWWWWDDYDDEMTMMMMRWWWLADEYHRIFLKGTLRSRSREKVPKTKVFCDFEIHFWSQLFCRNPAVKNCFFACRPIGSCNLVLYIHHPLMGSENLHMILELDESKYSGAMASVLFTWFFIHCKGRRGVILGSPKEHQGFSMSELLCTWIFLHRHSWCHNLPSRWS